MKPFIHLFKTLENFYFYDVNKNKNVRIEYNLYEYLNKIMSESNDFSVNNELEDKLNNLKKEGYLSDNRVEKIKHPVTDSLDLYLERKLRLLTIQLTHACNLRCSYCPYTSNDGTYRLHQNKRIDIDTIKKSLDILRDNSVDSDSVTIGFYGGEPLVEFGLIKKTVEICKEKFMGKEVNYTITTNGTLITEDILNFFEKENFQIVISLDGPKELNDRNRKFADSNKSVFDEVMKNITHIGNNYERLYKRITMNMVIDPTQDFNEYSLIFEEYPTLKNITTRASLIEDDYKTERYIITKEFRNDFNYAKLLSYLHYFGEINLKNDFYINMFFQSINRMWELMPEQATLGSINCPSGPCIPGNTRLMVSVDGSLFPCEKVSENIEFNCIGNVNNGFNIKKVERVINVADSIIESCTNCFAFRHCTLCVQAHEANLRDEDEMKNKCKEVRYNFHSELVGREIINEIIIN